MQHVHLLIVQVCAQNTTSMDRQHHLANCTWIMMWQSLLFLTFAYMLCAIFKLHTNAHRDLYKVHQYNIL